MSARFCPACGNRVEEGDTVRAELPPHETTAAPVDVERLSPRWFGLAPPTLLLVLSVLSTVVAVVLLVLGSWIAGLLVLGLTLLLVAAFLEAGRRKPDAEMVRTSVAAVDSVRARAGFAAESWRTRSAARREVLRRRAELLRLVGERERLVNALGEATYRGKDGAPLKRELTGLDERMRSLEAEAAEIVAHAGRRVRERRLEVQRTDVIRPPEHD